MSKHLPILCLVPIHGPTPLSSMSQQALAPGQSLRPRRMRRRSCPAGPSVSLLLSSSSSYPEYPHVLLLQGYVQEDNEADPTSANVKRKRYVRKNKKRKERETANPDCMSQASSPLHRKKTCLMQLGLWETVFHGPRLRFLYFQCAQLILRHQIRALILHWQLPPELEVSLPSYTITICIH